MDREQLASWLEEGVSIEEIARRVERHPSTVSYWMHSWGLRSAHADKHAPRGALGRAELVELIERDFTVREIAARVDRSPTTVRYWLQRYDLETTRRARRLRAEPNTIAECRVHGLTRHVARDDGRLACARCRAESVTRWRQRAKRILVAEAGGRCQCCGYDGCVAALEFHHVDRATKRLRWAAAA
ncbi:MAG TPA: helix-turn-helix domain-containing protein [Solirubrobacteraceae bacterium]|jgi:transposase